MDYDEFSLSWKHTGVLLLESLVTGTIAAYLFYESFWGLFGIPFIFFLLRKRKILQLIRERKNTLEQQFLDALRAVSTALLAGLSTENAWKEAQKEIGLLHGCQSYMYLEMDEMNRCVQMNIPLEQKLEEFAQRSKVESIVSFAEIFSFAKRSSGNFVQIIESTTARITQKYETGREIEVMIAAKKMEQKVMNVIPAGILLYLKISSMEFIDVLYGNILGICFMTGCLGVYCAAIALSDKILDIQL